MKKLPSLSYKEIIKVLKKVGFIYAPKRGKGSHLAFYRVDKEGRKFLVIVPKKKNIPKGTLLAIIEQSGLDRDTFIKILKD